MKKLLTRRQLALYLRVSYLTVINWCNGSYLIKGERRYYYPDKRKLKPVAGRGIKHDPFLYRAKDAIEYVQQIRFGSQV